MKCPSCDQQFWTRDPLEGHWESFHQPAEGDLMAEVFGCPRCGERRMDHLAWVEPHMEEVECQTCGQVYQP